MYANPDLTPTFILLSIFTPLGLIGTILGTVAIVTYHRRASRAQQIGGELVRQMLERNMSPDEIERVLAAWRHDPSVAKKFRKETTPAKQFAASL